MFSSITSPFPKHAHYLLCLLVVALFGVPSSVLSQGEAILYQEDFNSGQALNWQLEPGWQVVPDGRNLVLAGNGHQWARLGADRISASDFRLQLQIKLVQGRIHLVFGLNDLGRYFIGFQENGSDLNKQYWPDRFLNGLAGLATYHSPGVWHQVEVVMQSGRIQFLVDSQLEWEYTDRDPLLNGSFAFETQEDSIAYVDNIAVYGTAPLVVGVLVGGWSWTRTGGPLGGLGYDVRMNPQNPSIMYVTDAWSGVHMSTNGGQNWLPSNQGITTRTGDSGDAIPVFSLTVDPNSPNIVWAGTQYKRGIFKSTNGGQSWVKMDNGVIEQDGITFRGFTVDPRSSNIVYAAGEVSSWTWYGQRRTGREFDMTQGVVYKTTNGGQLWQAVWRGNNLARYIWLDPRNPDVVYVSTGIFDREAANSDPGLRTPGGVGIIKSSNGGQSWDEINEGLGNLYVGTLFMHPTNPDILLAGTGNNQYYEGGGVYLSTNGGASWRQTLQEDIIESVEFALDDPKIAYAGSSHAIYRSTNGGEIWEQVAGGPYGWGAPGVRAGFPIDFQVDPRYSNRIFANNYGGGNFLSEDGGQNWTVASQDYTGAQVRSIAVDPTAAGRVFVAARSGLFVSSNGGESWAGLAYPPVYLLDWTVVAVDPADPLHLFTSSSWNGELLESSNGGFRGVNWRTANPSPGSRMGWRAIAFAPSDSSIVYAGTAGFISAGTFDPQVPARGTYVSRNGGTTWSEANTFPYQDAHVTSLAVDPQDPLRVYAATSNYGVLKSIEGGLNWTPMNYGLPRGGPQALSIAVHPTNPSTIFTGLRKAGLYRSTDGGANWYSAAAGMNPEASVSAIVLDPTNPQVMYAADLHSGVYRSDNGGTSWQAINTGLRLRAVNALAISSDGLHLYAGTEGEGVFRLDLNGVPPAPAMPIETPRPEPRGRP
ncbi:MAG: hypothetical protein HY335_07135 [Deinococcus sp.]|nr:hypothetical protein [Deinococcus sp.]